MIMSCNFIDIVMFLHETKGGAVRLSQREGPCVDLAKSYAAVTRLCLIILSCIVNPVF